MAKFINLNFFFISECTNNLASVCALYSCSCNPYFYAVFITSCCFTIFSIFLSFYCNLFSFWFIFTNSTFYIFNSSFILICFFSFSIFLLRPFKFACILMFSSFRCFCFNCCITSTIFCLSSCFVNSTYSCFTSSCMINKFSFNCHFFSKCLFDRITVRLICCVVIFFQQTVNFINLFRACFTFKILECYACFIFAPFSICYCVSMSFFSIFLCCIPDCFSLFVCRICLFKF